MANREQPDVRFYPTDREQAELVNLLMEEHPGLDLWDYNNLMRSRILEWCIEAYGDKYVGGTVPRDFRARMWLQAKNDYPDKANPPPYPRSTWGVVLKQ